VLIILDNIISILLKQGRFAYYFYDPENIKHIVKIYPDIQAIQFNTGKHEQLINYIFTVGGDGTILFAAGLFQNRSSPPTISFSKGTVGFLCNFKISELQTTVAGLAKSLTN
jgi:NAD kinase